MKYNNKIYFLLLLVVFIIILNFSNQIIAETKEKTGEIEIKSERFELELKKSIFIFSGNVIVKFQDITVMCLRAIVYVNSKSNKITKVIMTGGVKIIKNDSFFYGEKVIFDAKDEKLTVEGKVYTKVKTPFKFETEN